MGSPTPLDTVTRQIVVNEDPYVTVLAETNATWLDAEQNTHHQYRTKRKNKPAKTVNKYPLLLTAEIRESPKYSAIRLFVPNSATARPDSSTP
jgi:hypothetical protein